MRSRWQVPGPSRPSAWALGGWIVGALAVALLLWTRVRPRPAPPAAPAPAAAMPMPAAAPPSRAAPAQPAVPAPDAASGLEDVVGRGIAAVVTVETPQGKGSAFFVAPDKLLDQRPRGGRLLLRDHPQDRRRDRHGLRGRHLPRLRHRRARGFRAPPAARPPCPWAPRRTCAPGQEVLAIGSPWACRTP